MEIEEIQALLSNFEELKKAIEAEKKPVEGLDDLIKTYEVKGHAIMDTGKRPDKIVELGEGKGTKVTPVARLAGPTQKKIVNLAAAFLCGNPIDLRATPADDTEKDLFSLVKRTWDDNKLDYDSKQLAKLMMIYTEVAELWYVEPVDKLYWVGTPNEGKTFALRMKIISPKYGDTLYPVYNRAGDMVAFARAYTLVIPGGTEEHFDIYMSDKTIKGAKKQTWEVLPEVNMAGKIPVIYYHQDMPEWADVQNLIDRKEKLMSNLADNNDYYAYPIMTIRGEIEGFADKGDQGKALKLTGNDAEAKMLTWPQAPESVKLEHDLLSGEIGYMTSTPNISLEKMISVGAFSGTALKMLFLDAHLKAADKEEIFGKGIQRRINFLKTALAKINITYANVTAMSVKPVFKYYLPENTQEIIDMLTTASGKPVMSRKTAVGLNPLVENPETEMEDIKAEQDSAGALNELVA